MRVDPVTEKVQVFPLPQNSSNANLNTATFDHRGVIWFTGQSGIYGRLDPAVGKGRSIQSSWRAQDHMASQQHQMGAFIMLP